MGWRHSTSPPCRSKLRNDEDGAPGFIVLGYACLRINQGRLNWGFLAGSRMAIETTFFRDLAYVFGAAVVGGSVARLLRQPLILGYVLVDF